MHLFLSSPFLSVNIEAIKSGKLTDDEVEALLTDKNWILRSATIITYAKRMTPAQIERAFKDKNAYARGSYFVFGDSANISATHISKALKDKEASVRESVVNNCELTPKQIQYLLVNETNENVRQILIRRFDFTSEQMIYIVENDGLNIDALFANESFKKWLITKPVNDAERNTLITSNSWFLRKSFIDKCEGDISESEFAILIKDIDWRVVDKLVKNKTYITQEIIDEIFAGDNDYLKCCVLFHHTVFKNNVEKLIRNREFLCRMLVVQQCYLSDAQVEHILKLEPNHSLKRAVIARFNTTPEQQERFIQDEDRWLNQGDNHLKPDMDYHLDMADDYYLRQLYTKTVLDAHKIVQRKEGLERARLTFPKRKEQYLKFREENKLVMPNRNMQRNDEQAV